MSAAFTPGPWKSYAGHIYKAGKDALNICSMSDPEAGDAVGYYELSLSNCDDPRVIANARLIAAAPELYAALDELLHALHPATQRIAAAKARDALAKARGQ